MCAQFWQQPWRYIANRDFGLYTASRLDWPLLASAAALIGGLPAAVLRGSHTMLFIPLLHKMTSTSDSERWERVGRIRFLLVVTTFVGSVLALAAQHDPESAAGVAAGLAQTAAGAALAVAGTMCASLSDARFPLAITVHRQLSLPSRGPAKEIPAMLLMHVVACLAAASVLCAVFGLPDLSALMPACALGFLALTAGLTTKSTGCLLSSDLSVNAISYATPLVAFVLFSVTGAAAGTNTTMIAVAAVIIVGSNAALSFTAPTAATNPNDSAV